MITPEALELIGDAVLRYCDLLDGLEDGVLNNPLACSFEVADVACDDGGPSACLAPGQIQAARKVYEGLTIDGEPVVPGFAPGGEIGTDGWNLWITGGLSVTADQESQLSVPSNPEFPNPVVPNAHFAFGSGVMKFLVFHDPDWDYSTYDFSTFRSDVAWVSSTLDATDPNLDAFRELGGKPLMFIGGHDMALTPLGAIEYCNEVVERKPPAAADVRLIMVPGMDHCSGGPGPSFVDWLDEIDRWVETEKAPGQVTAYRVDELMQVDGSLLACAYPKVLTCDGVGEPRDAASFSCVDD